MLWKATPSIGNCYTQSCSTKMLDVPFCYQESLQELEEKQTSSNVTSRPTTSSRRRTHSESGICRFMMKSFQ
uniref:Uncharacterized protein n=1 Tax=Cyanistes caeruleus TaxID=156563 RepID=A0A8C0UM00_CYACU